MAWSAPMTAATGTAITASQFNTYIRDNLLETMPGKITATGQYAVATGTNAIAARAVGSDFVHTASFETRGTNTFGDLTTVGPTVTITTGTSAMVWWAANMYHDDAGIGAIISVEVSGASSVAASDDNLLYLNGNGTGSGNQCRYGNQHLFTGLTAGSNTFRLKYRSSGAASTTGYNDRELIVMPF